MEHWRGQPHFGSGARLTDTTTYRYTRQTMQNYRLQLGGDVFALPGGTAPGKVLQLGCGRAGSATAHALLGLLDAEQIVLFDPDPARVEALRAPLAARFGAERLAVTIDPVAAARHADDILHASPVGMTKLPGMPVAAAAIEPRHWIADIIYFPLETAFLAEVRRKGCRTLDGSGMAVHQAVDAFAIFTGCNPETERMRASFFAFAAENGAMPEWALAF